MAGNGHWQAETSVDQDGLLPVVNFLQSALAMKAKVRWSIVERAWSCLLWDRDKSSWFIFTFGES